MTWSSRFTIAHGRPGSFVELVDLAHLLTDGTDGTDGARPAFHVVVPSTPGFGFSPAPAATGTSPQVVAGLWRSLMRRLGHDRFGVQGGGLGAGTSLRLALTFPDDVIAAHLNFSNLVYDPDGERESDPEAGAAADRRRTKWAVDEGGYSHLHATRLQTLGVALNDSPAGLAAWIPEKFHAWSDRTSSDNEIALPMDHLLTDLSIYWFTGCITSSIRIYRESAANPHFAAMEAPELLAADVRDHVASVR
ncbi:MAG: alpha/beta fold hydrolase [Terracoccus sp.]